jgi:hypothetical protein
MYFEKTAVQRAFLQVSPPNYTGEGFSYIKIFNLLPRIEIAIAIPFFAEYNNLNDLLIGDC